ncbi:PEGA domain-containing protein [Gimesia fumaroli]|uniref:PEGA domain protein n=1 Tax=Gimesia fumaroli TaxID=2527976 RepID=A0A518I919_9PLAN|nr:PEGA domain-containing protein [Gimesia fumaroli]QDV49605.1 PEGA domain protein [Gimesia fumaroli]
MSDSVSPDNSDLALSAPERVSVSKRRWLLVALLLLVSSTQFGCVHRRMTIRSIPSGALVKVDGEEIGYTPASVDFTYYGTREITLTKDGYETQTVMQKVKTPWYQVMPLDLVSDNLLPFEVTNRHEFTYQLQPKVVVPTEELLNRGNLLRSETQIGQ